MTLVGGIRVLQICLSGVPTEEAGYASICISKPQAPRRVSILSDIGHQKGGRSPAAPRGGTEGTTV
jgi:hypothetical protein